MTKLILRMAGALGFLLIAISAHADSGTPIIITKSGSTNSMGYRLTVTSYGEASYDNGSGTQQAALSPDLTRKLFADVEAALPLAQIQAGHCAKSASFGTKTTVAYGTDQSPDTSCTGTPASAQIYQDVQDIEKALNISFIPRQRLVRPIIQ